MPGQRPASMTACGMLLLAMCMGCAIAQTARTAGASVTIAQDDPGDAGTPLAADITRALQTDELVLSCPGVDGAGGFARSWVGVHRLDLDSDGRDDWVLNGRHDCLRQPGGPAYWWAYHEGTDGSRRLLLRAEPARRLEVLSSSTGGFRDLRVHLASGRGQPLSAESRYDGRTYRPARAEPPP